MRAALKTTKKMERRSPASPKLPVASKRVGAKKDGQQGRNSKEGLLQTAIDLFAKHGFEGVSTGDIASAAGYSQAIIHYHFRSKDQLWREALTYLMHDLDARFPLNLEELQDLHAVDRLRVIVRRFIAMSQYNTDLTSILIREALSDSERLKWLVKRHFQKRVDFLDDIIKQLIKSGEAKDIPSYLVTQGILISSSFLFCMAPLIKQVHGIDPKQRDHAVEIPDALLQFLLTGLLKG
jgi:TetR/AcrR family transcriptional regulator